MNKVLATLLVFFLAACTPTVMNQNANSISIQTNGSDEGTYEMGAQHCANYGKDAVVTHSSGVGGNTVLTFECR